jgi:CHAT domain-containing protein
VDPNVRYLHFATHAFVDERFPLNSGLVLSPSHRDGDGVLEAWEILDHFRTNAELVTLSGCDTGQGAVLGGEGSVGLTRAFHHAGARSVLASLWAVSDRSTADLMAVFYRELKAGRHKDEALQAAQLALLKEGDPVRFGHPFHWAGFRLFGDWR